MNKANNNHFEGNRLLIKLNLTAINKEITLITIPINKAKKSAMSNNEAFPIFNKKKLILSTISKVKFYSIFYLLFPLSI